VQARIMPSKIYIIHLSAMYSPVLMYTKFSVTDLIRPGPVNILYTEVLSYKFTLGLARRF
jgi:hypothetical protein